MYMIMFVLDDNRYLDDILKSWSELGLSGATIIESTGLHRRHIKRIPLRFTYGDVPVEETGNTTLVMVVENEQKVQNCLKAIEAIVGDLDQPNTGIFSAWPLTITKGISSHDAPVEGSK